MIGVVLVTHSRLAIELIAALEHIVGPQENIAPVCIKPKDNVDECRMEILKCTSDVDQGEGVIILTDMFGGTPSNLAISILSKGQIEVVAGVNLPMLVRLSSVRGHLTLSEAVESIQDAGRKYINVASQILDNQQA